ncbi:MAG TPA: hypothetical protein VFC38_09090 [Stellaceae bacterium]|nr:hypothetical protein [Stellaceae bacterium]
MATLEHLVASGKLRKHEPELDDGEMPEGIICLSPECDAWLSNHLIGTPRFSGRKLTAYDQVDQILYDFVIGRPMAYSVHYRKLEPVGSHVWELKTVDVRLFGWFCKKGHFVVVCGSLKNKLRKNKNYAPFIAKVIAFRKALDLDEPKAITGTNHNDIF